MTAREQLIREIEQAPDFLVEEVLNFLLFSKTRRNQLADDNKSANLSKQNKPIWESFEEFADSLPEEVASKLPTVGAAQVDHYLYGSPKRDT